MLMTWTPLFCKAVTHMLATLDRCWTWCLPAPPSAVRPPSWGPAGPSPPSLPPSHHPEIEFGDRICNGEHGAMVENDIVDVVNDIYESDQLLSHSHPPLHQELKSALKNLNTNLKKNGIESSISNVMPLYSTEGKDSKRSKQKRMDSRWLSLQRQL